MRAPISRLCRRGAALVLIVIVMPVLLGMMVLAVDLGYLYAVKADLDAAADAAALAGASGLRTSTEEAIRRATEYAAKNRANQRPVILSRSDIVVGCWQADTKVFTPIQPSEASRANAIQVTPQLSAERGSSVGLFFAGILGRSTANVSSTAIAAIPGREIALVLDYSASMSYDSQIRNVDVLGRNQIEAALFDIWRELGSPVYGTKPFPQCDNKYFPQFPGVRIPAQGNNPPSKSSLLNQLGLTNVACPYGHWQDYFDYVQGDKNNGNNESKTINDPVYQHRYGYLTLMDWVQAVKYKSTVTPDLWKTPQQPLTAVKNAVTTFLTFMRLYRTDDRVALISYTGTTGGGQLEVPLTDNYELVETTSRHMQAGHYHNSTNIAAGIAEGRKELVSSSRRGRVRVMVLLSDGQPNLPGNESKGRAHAISEARKTASERIPIITISLGAGADTELMQQIADITRGAHFVIPGGQSVAEYEDQLMSLFTQLVGQHPLRLVY